MPDDALFQQVVLTELRYLRTLISDLSWRGVRASPKQMMQLAREVDRARSLYEIACRQEKG